MTKQYIIPKDKAKDVILAARSVAFNEFLDELDCSKSARRQPTTKSFEEVLELCLKNPSIFSFIKRDYQGFNPEYFDIGCCTLALDVNYFIFLEASIEDGENLIKKFGLKEHTV